MLKSGDITRNWRRRVKYFLLFHGVMAIVVFSGFLTRAQWLWLCGIFGKIVFRVAPSLRMAVEHNLYLAYEKEKTPAEIKFLARQVFIMLGKNAGLVIRNFRKPQRSDESIVVGEEYARKAFKEGHGVIFLTAHLGPFECIAHELSIKGYHPYIVGTPLKDYRLNQLLIANRTKFGGVFIERGKDTFRVMKNIASGGTMTILIDQDTHVRSVFVYFFGKLCSTPVGAALLASKTGAAIVPVFTHQNKDGVFEINYYPAVKLRRTTNENEDLIFNTQKLTTIIENEIRRYPAQWVWMHRRWKTTPSISDLT